MFAATEKQEGELPGEDFTDSTPKPSYLSMHTPMPWFEGDSSYPRRARQYRLIIIQLVVVFFLKILKEVYLSTWNLYGDNADFFAVLTLALCFQFANVSHTSNNLAATKIYSAVTLVLSWLWVCSWILFGLVVQETIVCADVSKEDFRVLLDCYQMEPQALSDSSSLDCALGSDLKTRATGTCPGLEFRSESKGNAWLFFQYVIVLFWIVSIFINIMDSIKIVSVLVDINILEARASMEMRSRSIEELKEKQQGT